MQAEFTYEGFGFPVTLRNVPMIKVRGAWTPDIDYNSLSERLVEALALKRTRLTGSEIRFFRNSRSMTLKQFADRFDVTHPAVIKWERALKEPTSMDWATEKDIRLEMLQPMAHRDPAIFVNAYAILESVPSERPAKLRLEAATVMMAKQSHEVRNP